jgi:hypothetical protein
VKTRSARAGRNGKAIMEMPRDPEVIDLLKRLSAEGTLPAR